jgi:hypothetical protein
MKKTLLLFITVAVSGGVVSAQKAILHTTDSIMLFNGNSALISAYNAAAAGDTIYLSGGSFNQPGTIDKKLLIFGAGHYPDSTNVTGRTVIQGTTTLGANADGFHLEGVEINGDLTFASNNAIDNVIVKYCKLNNVIINGTTNHSNNLSFIRDVINSLNLYNATNVLVSNSIIGCISNSYGNIISNNVYYSYVYVDYYNRYLLGGDNNIISNNIFVTAGYGVNGNGNRFYYNLFVDSNPNYGTSPTVSGNYVNVPKDSIFVNQIGSTFVYTNNYHLKKPATYVGTDNTQVGIYGGSFPYKDGGIPSNPHFQFQNIAPTTNNGFLKVQIKAAAQNE